MQKGRFAATKWPTLTHVAAGGAMPNPKRHRRKRGETRERGGDGVRRVRQPFTVRHRGRDFRLTDVAGHVIKEILA